MDDKLIEKLISSDELIVKTIEENTQSMKTLIDQFSSIMSMTIVQGDKLEKQIGEQGEKEAEAIKGTLTESINQSSNISLEQVAEGETATTEESVLSDQTINSLIDVISNIQGVLENLNTQELQTVETIPTEVSTTSTEVSATLTEVSTAPSETSETTGAQISNINVGNLGQVIDDFKTLSNLNWCTDWLKCLEKIVEQADVVKDALSSIPSDKKVSLGIDEEELKKVDQSIQKVKENISSDINLSVAKSEMIEQAAAPSTTPQLSTSFLNSFSELTEKLGSFTEKVENNTISQESFVNKVSQYSETTSKTIENSFSTFNDTTKNILEKPSTLETSLESIESKVMTEVKPELPAEFNLEALTMPPQLQPVQVQAQIPTPPPLIELGELGAMPPTIQAPPVEVSVTKTIVSPPPPPMIPEMGFEGIMGVEPMMPLPMPPTLQKVEAAKGETPNATLPLPPTINFEDFLLSKSPMAEEKAITTEVNKEETSTLNLENLMNFETFSPLKNINSEKGFNISEIQKPIGFEELGAMPPIIMPKGVETPGVQVLAAPGPLGGELSSFNTLTGIEGTTNKTIVESIQNIALPNLNSFPNMFQMNAPETTIGTRGIEGSPIAPPSLSTNMEEMLIKNQEVPQINLTNAITKIQSEMQQPTSEIAASTEVMMKEINLEPLGTQLTSSISNLGENLKSKTPETPAATESAPKEQGSDVMGEILTMLTKLDTTLQGLSSSAGRGSGMASLGSSLSDAQARTIGRQIANELKDSFSRLYN